MKIANGRINSLTMIFKYYLSDNLMLKFKNETISVFSDGTYKRSLKRHRRNRYV